MLKKALRALVSLFQSGQSEGPGYPVLSFKGNGKVSVNPTDIFNSLKFKEDLKLVKQIADNGG